MKRMRVLFARRRMMVLATLTVLVLAAVALAGSSASFTAQSANPGNIFTAGVLSIDNSKPNQAVLTANLMVPGDVETGTVTITNTGNVPGDFSLDVSKSDELKNFGGKLELTISRGATELYSGTVNGVVGTSIDLGEFTPGQSATYTVTAEFPEGGSADNAYMGASVTVGLTFNAVNL